MTLRCLDMEALKAVPVTREPFAFFVVPGFVRPAVCADINRDYPKIAESGSFPVGQLCYERYFGDLIDEMASDGAGFFFRAGSGEEDSLVGHWFGCRLPAGQR